MIRRPPRSTLFPLHDALPIYEDTDFKKNDEGKGEQQWREGIDPRSEEHTSELQSHLNLVCRLLLEKKKNHVLQRAIKPVALVHRMRTGSIMRLDRLKHMSWSD